MQITWLGKCGDNIVLAGLETCDDGNTTTETACDYGTATCSFCNADCSNALNLTGNVCGDGNVDAGNEQCEDGNAAAGDGCDDNCQLQSQGIDCADIHFKNPAWPDGVYVIDPDEAAASSGSMTYTPVSYTHFRAHETSLHLVCRLLPVNNNIITIQLSSLL